ncbi:hypothetical protein RND71_005943 [Anisodus tanguticus]|uniref:Uncharacterized protein n=1 Tax=Anisodus tanguticus TaxID=243964 RepID=A0AAE1VST5_9SOLA|nr:hypothetical protein RND71_005943 [Anisodus tanguticus]
MVGHLTNSADLQSLIKKKGWVCNELGRRRLERKEQDKAEVAFADAINAFKEVADHTNIILMNCNLGHGRRALAEEMVAKIENLKELAILHDAYRQVLQAAKKEFRESLRFYGAAKTVVNNVNEESDLDSSNLRNEVYTQFAHTYLRLGMLLAREDTFAEVYENCVLEDSFNSRVSRPKIDRRKHEISANVAIREALSVYESLGELRKQESAYAHFQLACYQRDCCLKFLEQVQKKNNSSKGGNSFLHREVYTQFAHTYLRLGMLLAREDTFAEVYENCVLEDSFNSRVSRPKIDRRKHEISANVAIREALSVYESLGELRKQESAYAHFQLACYQRKRKTILPRAEIAFFIE